MSGWDRALLRGYCELLDFIGRFSGTFGLIRDFLCACEAGVECVGGVCGDGVWGRVDGLEES